jgi:glycosyltransferase involved in cell wall biosynthesis
LTSRPPEQGDAERLRLAWFGHAVGARADGLTSYSSAAVSGLLAAGAEVWFHHAGRDGSAVPVDEGHRVGWPTWRFKTVTVPGPGFHHQMSGWLARTRPDVVHASLSFTLADGWLGREARRRGAATVVTFHLPFGRKGSGRALVMRELHRFWAPRLRGYQRVIVFSEEHRLRLGEVGVDPERIVVLPNAVDTKRFSPGPSALRQSRLGGAKLVVGYAGRLDPEKGVRELLAGFQAAQLGPDARLVVAGSGVLQDRVREAQRDPRVLYLGQLLTTDQRVDFWRAVDLFCLPSNAEGLSIALLEAMASGCAVAATPAGGSELVGETAARLDPLALGRSITELLDTVGRDPDELALRGRRARREAERHHEMSDMVARLMTIYRDCLAHRS